MSRIACSTRTSFHSTSSSSAISMGSMVLTPWPISGFLAMMVTAPLGSMRMKATGTKAGGLPGPLRERPRFAIQAQREGAAGKGGHLQKGSAVEIGIRRHVALLTPFFAGVGRMVNGLPDARIGSATAEIAAHGGVDVGISGLGRVGQQGGGGHDLAGLAVAALGHVHSFPGFLHGMAFVCRRRKPLDGGDGLAGDAAHVRHAGAHRLAANQDRAGAAGADTAAVLGAFQVQHIAQDPKERRVGRHIDRPDLVVHFQLQWHWGHLIAGADVATPLERFAGVEL